MSGSMLTRSVAGADYTSLRWCCGAECGIVSAGAGGGTGVAHISTITGTAPTVSSVIARNGGKAFRFNPTAATSHIRKDILLTPTIVVARGYFRFETLPNVDTIIMSVASLAGSFPMLRFRVSTTDVIADVGVAGATTPATPKSVTTGVWYCVDFKCDLSGTTRSCTVSIDSGAPTTALQTGAAASTAVSVRFGASCGSDTPTCDVYWDDLCQSQVAADWPIGPGSVIGLFPISDGTHSYSAAGDFKYDDVTNVALAATDTYQSIDHSMDSISTFLAAAGVAAGEYLEWLIGTLPSVIRINGAEVVSAHHATTTSTDLQTMRMVDGAQVADVFTDGDFSQVTLVYNSRHYTFRLHPGLDWTQAAINALKFRWGSSWTVVDISPVPYINGLMVEVDVVPSPDRRGIVTFAELEVPLAPRRARVTFAELEVPNAPRRCRVTWAELEVPTAPTDKRAVVTWAELEVPTAPRRARVTFAELEVPTAPRRARVTFAEMEVPTAPRRCIVTQAYFETSIDRRAIVTFAEFEIPTNGVSKVVHVTMSSNFTRYT